MRVVRVDRKRCRRVKANSATEFRYCGERDTVECRTCPGRRMVEGSKETELADEEIELCEGARGRRKEGRFEMREVVCGGTYELSIGRVLIHL